MYWKHVKQEMHQTNTSILEKIWGERKAWQSKWWNKLGKLHRELTGHEWQLLLQLQVGLLCSSWHWRKCADKQSPVFEVCPLLLYLDGMFWLLPQIVISVSCFWLKIHFISCK
jgi:lipopolysaccharide biosynthesis glycosyltransferase